MLLGCSRFGVAPQELCLHPLVAAKHDRAVLFEALRGLPAAAATALLSYLHTCLRHHTQLLPPQSASGICHCRTVYASAAPAGYAIAAVH